MYRTTVFFMALFAAAVSQATTVVYWSFESPNVPPSTIDSTISGILPTTGSGTASGYHGELTTSYSSGVGNGSLHALTANSWNPGDNWQFQFSTLGFTGINLDWDMTSSGIGPTNFILSFSTDGVNFSLPGYPDAVADPNPPATWNSSTVNSASHFSRDLSSFTDLNNAATVYIRLECQTPSILFYGPNGINSVDNFLVTGTAVPEPSSMGLVGAMAVAGVLKRRRII